MVVGDYPPYMHARTSVHTHTHTHTHTQQPTVTPTQPLYTYSSSVSTASNNDSREHLSHYTNSIFGNILAQFTFPMLQLLSQECGHFS